MTPSTADMGAEVNGSTAQATTAEESATTPLLESFPFLQLPRDIRLIVYDNMMTRTHQRISLDSPNGPATVTLVLADPIPPIHRTCKLLHAEAGSFVKAKLVRMSSPWAAPRLIIHSRSANEFLLVFYGLVDEVVYQISENGSAPLCKEFATHLPLNELHRKRILDTLRGYTTRTAKFMSDLQVPSCSWKWEAQQLLESDSGRRDNEYSDDECYDAAFDSLAKELQIGPQRGLFQIVLLFNGVKDTKSEQQNFLKQVHEICDAYHVRTSLRTIGWGSEVFEAAPYDDFVRFDGEMPDKIWNEEWA